MAVYHVESPERHDYEYVCFAYLFGRKGGGKEIGCATVWPCSCTTETMGLG